MSFSGDDMFAPESQCQEREFQTTSAPLISDKGLGLNPSDYEYLWLIIFKASQVKDGPFDIVAVEDLLNDHLFDPKWMTGILSPTSRMRYRELSELREPVRLFAKIEKSKEKHDFYNVNII